MARGPHGKPVSHSLRKTLAVARRLGEEGTGVIHSVPVYVEINDVLIALNLLEAYLLLSKISKTLERNRIRERLLSLNEGASPALANPGRGIQTLPEDVKSETIE
jgi:hypothetical protein